MSAHIREYLFSLPATSATSIAAAQTVLLGASFTLAAGAATIGGSNTATQVSAATTGTTFASAVITITGTDADDNVITDTITGLNNNTVATTKTFKTVTSAVVTVAAITTNTTLGSNGIRATKTMFLDPRDKFAASCAIQQTGTSTWTLQETYKPITYDAVTAKANGFSVGTLNANYATSANFSAKTGSTVALVGVNATGIRLLTASLSSTPSFDITVTHSGG